MGRTGQYIIHDAYIHVEGTRCWPRIVAYYRNQVDPRFTVRIVLWTGREYQVDEIGAEEELLRALNYLDAIEFAAMEAGEETHHDG